MFIIKNLKGKRLLLLGGNMFKDSIKQIADAYGIYLIAVSNDPDAEIFDIADEKYVISSTDSDAMKAFIKEHRIDGVYMGCSEPVISVACQYIAELGLPCYCTKKQWDFLQNKVNFKNLCIEHGLPVVPQYAENDIPKSEYPVIVKPVDGCGSKGFSVCKDEKEIKEAVSIAKENSASKKVLIEKFVKNEGVVAFYTFSNGEAYFSGLEDKYPVRYSEQDRYVAGMLIFESSLEKEFRTRFEDKIKNAFSDIGIKEGTIWMEVFHNGDDYFFNEAGYRYGGSISIYSVDYVCGINQLASDIYYALTGESMITGFDPLIPKDISRGKHYAVYSLHISPGRISSLEGYEELLANKNVIVIPTAMSVGRSVEMSGTIGQVFGFVHFVFDTIDECREMVDLIHDTIKIIDENGNNMLLRKIDFESKNIVL